MPIIDLTPEHEALYWQCLEDWSTDMAEAGPRREIWYRTMLSKGLRVKLALTEEGVIAGFIQYLPVRESTLIGEDGYFICWWWRMALIATHREFVSQTKPIFELNPPY